MYPSTERILGRRHTVLIVLRMFCLILFVIGAIWFIVAIVPLALWTFSSQNFSSSMRQGLLYPTFGRLGVAAACLIPAAVLLGLNQKLAKWLVPLPRFECPRCSYALDRLDVQVCPECGVQLAPPVAGPQRPVPRQTSGQG